VCVCVCFYVCVCVCVLDGYKFIQIAYNFVLSAFHICLLSNEVVARPTRSFVCPIDNTQQP